MFHVLDRSLALANIVCFNLRRGDFVTHQGFVVLRNEILSFPCLSGSPIQPPTLRLAILSMHCRLLQADERMNSGPGWILGSGDRFMKN